MWQVLNQKNNWPSQLTGLSTRVTVPALRQSNPAPQVSSAFIAQPYVLTSTVSSDSAHLYSNEARICPIAATNAAAKSMIIMQTIMQQTAQTIVAALMPARLSKLQTTHQGLTTHGSIFQRFPTSHQNNHPLNWSITQSISITQLLPTWWEAHWINHCYRKRMNDWLDLQMLELGRMRYWDDHDVTV